MVRTDALRSLCQKLSSWRNVPIDRKGASLRIFLFSATKSDRRRCELRPRPVVFEVQPRREHVAASQGARGSELNLLEQTPSTSIPR